MWIWVRMVVCLSVPALQQTDELSRVYPASCPVITGVCSRTSHNPEFYKQKKMDWSGLFFSFWREERWKKQQPCKPQGESKIGSNFDYFHFYLFLLFLFYMKAINENNTHEKQISVLLYNTAKTVERVLKSWLINAFGTSCTHLCTCLIPW